MSNYLSQPIKYAAPPTDANFELLSKVALMQQQKYDVNHQQIQATLDAFGSMKTLRPEDDAYIAAKLNGIANQINASGGNLANQSLSDSLIGKIKGAAQDPFILNAMEQTAKMKNYQAEIAKIKEKNKADYSDINYSYGLAKAGYEDYMSGKTDKMGTLSYIPYTDVAKSSIEKLKQFKDLKGEQVVEFVDESGIKHTQKINGLSEAEIFKYFPNILSPEESQQLNIDGWHKYKNNMPGAQEAFKGYVDASNKMIDEQIKEQEAIKNNTSNGASTIAAAEESIKILKASKEEANEDYKSVDINNPFQLGALLHQKEYRSSLSKMAKASVSETTDYDYYKQKGLELDIEKNIREAEKHKAEMNKAAGLTPDGLGAAGISVAAKAGEALPESFNTYDQYQTDYNKEYNNVIGLSAAAYNKEGIDEGVKEHYQSVLKRNGYKIVGDNIVVDNAELAKKHSKAAAAASAYSESKLSMYTPDISEQLFSANAKRASISKDLGSAKQIGYVQEFNKDADNYIETLKMVEDIASNGSLLDSATGMFSNIGNMAAKAGGTGAAAAVLASWTGLGAGVAGAVGAGIGASVAGVQNIRENNANLKLIGDEINKFVKENGGWGKLKENIKNDAGKIQKLAELTDKVRDASSAVFEYPSGGLNTKAKKAGGDYLQSNIKSGKNAYFTTSNVANITDKDTREAIINMMPQGAVEGESFSADKPMSFEKTANGEIVIYQNSGVGYKKGEPYSKAASKIIVSTEDDIYKVLMSKIDLDESSRGLNAKHTKSTFTPMAKPEYISKENTAVLGVAQEGTRHFGDNLIKAFGVHPAFYLTKEDTNIKFKEVFKDKIKPEDIDNLTNNLNNNFYKFKVTLKPINGLWGMEVKKGNKIIQNGQLPGMEVLDKKINMAVNDYPQIFIVDAIKKYLTLHPEEVNTILK